ncbi:MAG: hypothetical protein DRJ51_06330 [Thermoprotei archaeon]|nr:MAG: hypothetical protein DRJ51_06330 [Thermoprotei archaeon]
MIILACISFSFSQLISSMLLFIAMILHLNSISSLLSQYIFGTPIPATFVGRTYVVMKKSRFFKYVTGLEVLNIHGRLEEMREEETMHKANMLLSSILSETTFVYAKQGDVLRSYVLVSAEDFDVRDARGKAIQLLRGLWSTFVNLGCEVRLINNMREVFNIEVERAKVRWYLFLPLILIFFVSLRLAMMGSIILGLVAVYSLLLIISLIVKRAKSSTYCRFKDVVLVLSSSDALFTFPSSVEVKQRYTHTHYIFNQYVNDYIVLVRVSPALPQDYASFERETYRTYERAGIFDKLSLYVKSSKMTTTLRRIHQRGERLYKIDIYAFFKSKEDAVAFQRSLSSLGFKVSRPLIMPQIFG